MKNLLNIQGFNRIEINNIYIQPYESKLIEKYGLIINSRKIYDI